MEPVVLNRENGDTYIINPSHIILLRRCCMGVPDADGNTLYEYYARFVWGKLHLSSSEFRQLAEALEPANWHKESE